MTLFSRVTEICRERLPSIRVARITIDSIFDLDKMLQPGIRFGVTVRNTIELVGTPIASMGNFYFSVDVMDGDERWIIQKMENWRNGTYQAFYRIFYDEECVTRLDGVDGEELGWRNAYDVFQLNAKIKRELEKRVDLYNLSVNVPAEDGYYTMDKDDLETPYAPDYVPVENRKVGLLITFMSYTGWQTWQYKGIEAILGEVLEDDWLNPFYWKQKDAESVLTKQLIESLLTGEIKSHRHPSSNYVLDSSSSQYGYYVMEQDAPMQASKSVPAGNRFIHLTISFQTLTAWESWQFIGTDITTQWNNVDYWLKIPVGPSLALGEELGTAYEGSKGKANADEIASIASKLEGIQDNAEVNQFAFSNIIVGSSTIASTTKTDTFELVEGSNITLSSSGKKITISSSNVDADFAALAGSTSQDFSTKNLNVAGYIQVGSARLVYVPANTETGTPGYIKIQHSDGSTAMHLITTGGQTLYSTGVPAAIEEHLLEAHSGVYNLTVNVPPTDDFYTLSVQSLASQYAPTYVPVGVRKVGLIITFRSHSEWETWQFVGAMESFLLPGDWKRIDSFIETGAYDMDAEHPLYNVGHYQLSNNDDPFYIPSVIPINSRVAFMKVRYINSYGQRVILRYASSDFAHFHDYDYWDVLKVSDLSSADIEKMLTGLITTHYHDTVQTDRVTPVEAVNAPIARSFSLDPHSAGQGYLIITDAYTFSATITIELTMSYLIQDSFYRYVLYIDMRHSGPLQLAITKDGGDIILKGDSTLNMSLEKGIYKIEFIRQMSSGTDLVLYARHDFIPDDVL